MFVVGKIVQDWSRVCAKESELNWTAACKTLPCGQVGVQEDPRVTNDHHRISWACVNFAPLHRPLSASIVEITCA
jgi:hypothetical protein